MLPIIFLSDTCNVALVQGKYTSVEDSGSGDGTYELDIRQIREQYIYSTDYIQVNIFLYLMSNKLCISYHHLFIYYEWNKYRERHCEPCMCA